MTTQTLRGPYQFRCDALACDRSRLFGHRSVQLKPIVSPFNRCLPVFWWAASISHHRARCKPHRLQLAGGPPPNPVRRQARHFADLHHNSAATISFGPHPSSYVLQRAGHRPDSGTTTFHPCKRLPCRSDPSQESWAHKERQLLGHRTRFSRFPHLVISIPRSACSAWRKCVFDCPDTALWYLQIRCVRLSPIKSRPLTMFTSQIRGVPRR